MIIFGGKRWKKDQHLGVLLGLWGISFQPKKTSSPRRIQPHPVPSMKNLFP
jgi:hypothetical protein